jgi:hypothetical protein
MIKRILSLAFAVLMLAALSITAFAENDWSSQVTYNRNGVTSVRSRITQMSPGQAHPTQYAYGSTFDNRNGRTLQLTDVLKITPDTAPAILAREFARQFPNPYGPTDRWDAQSMAKLQGVSNWKLPYWLEKDGVHVYYGQYTFFYAYGARELIIPFGRKDLVQPLFAQ